MKKISLLLLALSASTLAYSQNIANSYNISKQDLRGTARFVSMGGAFGALGGDLSTLSQNPAGIGVYRSNEVGITVGLDMINAKADDGYSLSSKNCTRFSLNNIGGVFTFKINNTIPNINFGFTYNKAASFNRKYTGNINHLNMSMSNFIAGITNTYGLNESDVSYGDNYDPYNPPAGHVQVPWLAVMGYYGFLTSPEGNKDKPHWYGQYGDGTTGLGYFDIYEKGQIDEYNIALGGNISNKFFWGMDFDITSISYKVSSTWGESLNNAWVYNPNTDAVGQYNADWVLHDNYSLHGTGFNFKLGVIFKPIQELRIGLAFHTPTYYRLEENYYDAHIDYKYPFKTDGNQHYANDGYDAIDNYDFRTPWRVIASVAGVIGQRLIVSADYQWDCYNKMKYSAPGTYWDPHGYWYDPWDYWYGPWDGWMYSNSRSGANSDTRSQDYYRDVNDLVKEVSRNMNTVRLGAEFRVLPTFSLRAGYCYQSSPLSTTVKDHQTGLPYSGVKSNYTLDDDTYYVTCGAGYRYKGFYIDAAYVYKHNKSEYFPFSPDVSNPASMVKSDLTFKTSSIVLSMGVKF